MLRAKLLGWRSLAPEVQHFDFEVPAVEHFNFTPGQFVSVVQAGNGREITRAYSIASPRDGNRFSLCLNRVADGLISPFLFGLPVGAEIDIHEPLGYFTLRHPGHRCVFIATGTGVAPFRSILLDTMQRLEPRINLLFGVRYPEGLLYRDEIERLAQAHPNFRFLPTVTRATPDWQGRTGRVLEHLDEALDLQTPQELATVDVYICGLKEMVDDVRRELKARGFDRKQIIYEKYD